MKKLLIGCMIALVALAALAAESDTVRCPQKKVVPERLPDLNIPRLSNHAVYCQNGELTIFGGHTTGFVLTPTAEYYSDGEWHLIPMTYNHDMGLYVRLSSGKVLLGGGATQNLGIGQSFETEVYDPATHTFGEYGCLDKKRFHSAGIELDSGRVIITGNWYTKDAIEQYDTLTNTFKAVKAVAQQRSHPYIFRTARDNAIILSGISEYGDTIFSPVIDRLKGEPFTVSLFDSWRPLYPHNEVNGDDSFIGDATRGDYAYLLPVVNRKGQLAIAEVRDTAFTLLPTACPVPMESRWGRILWFGSILVDRQAQRGYLMGHDQDCRQFFLAIDYAAMPAELTLFYTDPMPDAGCILPVISPDGDLYVIGGGNYKHNYFNPLGSVLCYRFGQNHGEIHGDRSLDSAHRNHGPFPLMLILLPILLLAVLALFILIRRRRRSSSIGCADLQPQESLDRKSMEMDALMQRIEELMVEKRLYLNSNLKMSDVAAEFGIHQNEVSACINSCKGYSFSQFINNYRIAYAQQLLRNQPDAKMTHVALESGFASDTSFFRTFKSITGMTPSEWKDSGQ